MTDLFAIDNCNSKGVDHVLSIWNTRTNSRSSLNGPTDRNFGDESPT